MPSHTHQSLLGPAGDYQVGGLLVSEVLKEKYARLPPTMRTIMEHGKRQENYVFCTEKELFTAPERFGLSAEQLEQYRETIAEYGGFSHHGREFILPSSSAHFSSVIQWMGLSAILQELRVEPQKWQSAVFKDLGLTSEAVPNHLVDPLPLRKQYAPAIIKSLKTHLGIKCTAEQINHENPRYWLQMVVLNAVAGKNIEGVAADSLPHTQRIYGQLLEKAAQKAQLLEDAALTDTQILATAHRDAADAEARPRFYTKDPQERSMLLQATRTVDACLAKDAERNKFRCRLNSAKSGYSITMVLGDGRSAPEEHTIQTHAKNLDQAVALKRALQSHILNRKDITPLRYTYREQSSELRSNELIPAGLKAPDKAEARNGYYVARFWGQEMQEGATKPVEMIFPLGVRFDKEQPEAGSSQAAKRLEWLTRHLQVNDRQGIHETREELSARMRKYFTSQPGKRWQEAPSLDLQGMEDGPVIDLGFPGKLRGQTTSLSNVKIRYTGSGRDAEGNASNEAEDSRNPSWHLGLTLTVHANGQEYKYQPYIRLQTSNEEAALRKAELIIEQLQQSFWRLSHQNESPYPELQWQMRHAQQRGYIQLSTDSGETLPAPEPQYLSDIVDDAVALVKSDFHIHSTLHSHEGQNNQHFSLAVHRGWGAERDLATYQNMDKRLMVRQFSAAEPEAVQAFADAVNNSFRDAVQETYSTRAEQNGVVKRIPLQRFNDRTIENRFNDAVSTHLNDRRFAGKITELEHTGAVAMQGARNRVRE